MTAALRPENLGQTLQAVVAAIPESDLRSRRWFAGKARRIEGLRLADYASLAQDGWALVFALLEVRYGRESWESGAGSWDQDSDVYSWPLFLGEPRERPSSLPIATVPGVDVPVFDALDVPFARERVLQLLAAGETLAAQHGDVVFEAFSPLDSPPSETRLLGVEQSNTSVAYGREWILKSFRKIAFGQNRDLEVGRFLTREASFPHTPRVAGAVTYAGDRQATLGVLQQFVENEGDCWGYVLGRLPAAEQDSPNAPDDVYWAQDGLPDLGELLLADVERLGQITGGMHLALGSRPDIPSFAPEAVSEADVSAWLADLRQQRAAALAAAQALRGALPADLAAALDALPDGDPAESAARHMDVGGLHKVQIHGDYHLGQVLKTRDGFAIIDFEGEPARPIEERRAKQPPLRDVAGMLRSLHYAAHTAWQGAAGADEWASEAGERFYQGWLEGSEGRFIARSDSTTRRLLRLFQLTKAYYELNYELNNRPGWAAVPLRGIRSLVQEIEP